MCFYRKQLRKLDTLPGTGYTKKRKKIKGFLLESKRFARNADVFPQKHKNYSLCVNKKLLDISRLIENIIFASQPTCCKNFCFCEKKSKKFEKLLIYWLGTTKLYFQFSSPKLVLGLGRKRFPFK